jgi:mRNA-degrading endonuclease toxin of MazEF toxin-antitoxin module
MQPQRGDVVRSTDPFKLGTDKQRPWLILTDERHPFANEQFIAVAISRKEYAPSIPLLDEVWKIGGVPEESFAAPWSVHSPRIEDMVAWQGRVTESFVERVACALWEYLR